MAKPILNVVPAYDVSNGVTLTFDANYGTSLVRGSKVTIYDQNQNVVAWHIYTPSTYELAGSQHILPDKDVLLNESITPDSYDTTATYNAGAIVSFDGSTYISLVPNNIDNAPDESPSYWEKILDGVGILSYTSDDFNTDYVNETQFQYCIQTFVDYTISSNVITLVGLSNSSNIRGAWVLPTPTITIDLPPTHTVGVDEAIETTSCTIGVTYDTNQTTSIGSVYNPMEHLNFTLKRDNNGSWENVTSKEVYNSGTRVSDTEYYLNYTFSELANNTKYIIEIVAHSLLGMDITSFSIPFIVDAITYQISTFNIENDCENGRIAINSKIIDIVGKSNREVDNGEIDLTNGGYCQWDDGFSTTNNWMNRIWGYDFEVADTIPSAQSIIHMESSTTNGVIDGYVVEDGENYRFDLYVYPTGYGGVTNYYRSNAFSTLGTQSNPLCIIFGFDYDNTGTYFVEVVEMGG